MGSTTTNYGLYKPTRAEKDWDAHVNDSFDIIDAALKDLEDTKADLGSGAGVNLAGLDAGGGVVDSGVAVADATKRRFHTALVMKTPGTVGTGEACFRFSPLEAATLKDVGALVRVPSSSGDIILDVQYSTDDGGTFTSLLTTYITIEAGERSSAAAAFQPVVGVSALPENCLVRGLVLQSGTGAEDVVIVLALEA